MGKKIEKTMPEDEEDMCVGEDAKQVAAYIYEAFYSPAAQARSSPPEQDLSRLTIAQHRASIMDLIGRFRQGPGFDRPISTEHGIKGFYRGLDVAAPPQPDAKVKDRKKRPAYKFERVDSRISFYFGADSPDKEKMSPEEFQNRWDGCVIAEETGVYEFAIKTENVARLWINDDQESLIDACVSA